MKQKQEDSGGYSGKRLVLNSASNTVRFGIFVVITFFLTPFIVRGLGNTRYGLWVLMMSFVGYAEMLELGLQRAMVKLVAENRAAGNTLQLNRQMSAAFFFFLGAGLLVILFFSIPLPLLIGRIARDVDVGQIPYILFPIVGVDVAITFLNYVFTGILYGWQHYHRRNIVDVSMWIANAALVLILLGRWGLVGLAAAKALSDLGGLLTTTVLCRRTVPDLSLSLRNVTRSAMRDLFSFGGKIFVSSTMSRIATNAQPIIISGALSASATAFFSIPKRLLDTVRQIHWAMVAGFMPMFSDLDKRGDTARIRDVYLDYSRRVLLIMLPIVALVMIDGAPFIGIWIGPEYAQAGGGVILFLAVAYLAELFQPLLWSLFIGVGRLNLLVFNSSGMSILIILLTLAFIRPLGITGAALATAIAFALGQVMFTVAVCRQLSLSFFSLFRMVHLRPLVLTACFSAMVWGGGELAGTGSYLALMGGALPGIAIYLPLFFRFGLNAHERERLLARLPRRR
jgi:O-antigen/teichoic acid export membrane protein